MKVFHELLMWHFLLFFQSIIILFIEIWSWIANNAWIKASRGRIYPWWTMEKQKVYYRVVNLVEIYLKTSTIELRLLFVSLLIF